MPQTARQLRMVTLVKPAEREIFHRAAQALDVTLSDFVRVTLLTEARRVLLAENAREATDDARRD